VQYSKLKRLHDELAQALMRNSGNLEQLIARAVAYTDSTPSKRDVTNAETVSISTADAEVAGFDTWRKPRGLERRNDGDSEVATLRQRNAWLAEENHRLKVACAAEHTMMRNRERKRERLKSDADANRQVPELKGIAGQP
jgi:hypothetical protein